MARGPQKAGPKANFQTVTIREFDGGLNVVDNPLDLSPKFAPVLDNWMRGPDGALQVRWGYVLAGDIAVAVDGTGNRIVTGDILNAIFFQGYLVVVTSTGQVGLLNLTTAVLTVVWNQTIAHAQTGNPNGWDPTTLVTFYTFGKKLIIMNGINKPLELDTLNTPICQYQADPASGSNIAIPTAKYGTVLMQYVVLGGEVSSGISGPTQVDISEKQVASVYQSNTDPGDAVSIDMSKRSNVVDCTVTGVGVVRGKLVITYQQGITTGTLGIYATAGDVSVHNPDLNDNIEEFGCVGGRTMCAVGSEMLLCDKLGVPKLTLNSLGNYLSPTRASDLIEPLIQRNVARLQDSTLETRCFAVFNRRDKQYMLFMPKFENTPMILPDDPITFYDADPNIMMINVPAHSMDVDDPVTISGSLNIGENNASLINISSTIASIPDPDTIAVKLLSPVSDTSVGGGGVNVRITPNTTETVGYILRYNPAQKEVGWSRFRGLSLQWAASSTLGEVYWGIGTKIYRYGNADRPVYGDALNDYDHIYAHGITYDVGDIVLDPTTDVCYECLVANTTVSSNFPTELQLLPNNWTVSKGVPIEFDWEWPWADFGKRMGTKRITAVHVDADGSGEFNLQVFVDNLYKDAVLGNYTPQLTLPLEAGRRGFGHGTQGFGGGRSTGEEVVWLLPTLAKLYKLRLTGSTTDPLRVVAISLVYSEGGMRR